jgi:hypothetical protein
MQESVLIVEGSISIPSRNHADIILLVHTQISIATRHSVHESVPNPLVELDRGMLFHFHSLDPAFIAP